jgi:vancomycin permeability regulator SanA
MFGRVAAAPVAVPPPVVAVPVPVPRRRRFLQAAAVLAALAVAGTVGANVYVVRAAEGLAYDDVATVPARSVAIVFGAFVDVSRQPSSALADRLRSAVALYQEGRVTHLLMTGDNSRPEYDEVTVMRDFAIAQGVPAAAISRDYAGFNTYDSCSRARSVFGVTDAILVTQDYHISRALLLCRDRGIDAVGLAVPDWQHLPERAGTSYPPDMQISYMLREYGARTKALFDSRVLRRPPGLNGPFVGLNAG